MADNAEISALHQALVDHLKQAGHIQTLQVEAAFRAIPRHLFLPDAPLEEVYRDQSIPTKRLNDQVVSSSSQPAIMAIMLEQLELQPGHRVLEIGAGTGYNAALMAHLVGDTGQVVTIDLDEDIVEHACEHLKLADFDQVQVICRDGGLGYPAAAPYDRIVLTVGAWDIISVWLEQLKPGGRLLLPLSIRGPQLSIAFEQVADHLSSISIKPCGFMPLRGAFAGPQQSVPLGLEPGLTITVENTDLVEAEAIYSSLIGSGQNLASPIQVTLPEIFGGLNLWLALREQGFCSLHAQGKPAEAEIIPDLFRFSSANKISSTMGLVEQEKLCLLMRSPDQTSSEEQGDKAQPFQLFVRTFGPDHRLASHLIEQITAWDAAGRPSVERLCIRAYPHGNNYIPSTNDFVIQKQFTQLVLHW